MNRQRRYWLIFSAGCLLVLAVLVGISWLVLRLEGSDRRARLDAEYQESLRLAMWRMDSWLAPHLSREAGRQPVDYEPFQTPRRAVAKNLSPIAPGDVLIPSPLSDFRSEFLILHFQWNDGAGLTSPQLPAGTFGQSREQDDRLHSARREAFARLDRLIDPEELRRRLALVGVGARRDGAGSESGFVSMTDPGLPGAAGDPALKQSRKNEAEYRARVSCAIDMNAPPAEAGELGRGIPEPPGVGPLVPVWLGGAEPGGDNVLVLVRRVLAGRDESFQGALVDTARLTTLLLSQIRDLFPSARLLPRLGDGLTAGSGSRDMAMLPFTLIAPAPPPPAASPITPTRAGLAIGWLMAIAALAALGLTLFRSIDFGTRRERFVSAVTHELRTPLTTFQMYASMLDEGMVRDETRKKTYLKTLREESARLSAMVENVLAFARLERGKPPPRRGEPLTVSGLLERVTPPLLRRAESAGMNVRVTSGAFAEHPVEVDCEPIGQVLLNLVDNACKYARDAADPTIHVDASVDDGHLRLRVRDHGPGVSPGDAPAVFTAFERGGREAANGASGIGLGLSISRGLAREMGGDLTLEPGSGGGASFLLEIPLAARPS